MSELIKNIEDRIEKREKRIKKLQASLKEEKIKLRNDENTLLHVKYDNVLKTLQDNDISPEEALKAIVAEDSEENNNN